MSFEIAGYAALLLSSCIIIGQEIPDYQEIVNREALRRAPPAYTVQTIEEKPKKKESIEDQRGGNEEYSDVIRDHIDDREIDQENAENANVDSEFSIDQPADLNSENVNQDQPAYDYQPEPEEEITTTKRRFIYVTKRPLPYNYRNG